MTESTKDAETKKDTSSGKGTLRRVLLIGGVFILGFVVLGVIAVRVWDYSNSPAFCADVCHEVHPEETITYQDSYHAKVQCTECHMGRVSMLNNIFLKASHIRHIPEALFGQYDRPLESQTLRPANESCELCHWTPAHQGDHVLEIRRFLPDEDNTEERTYLVLKIGGGAKDPLTTGMGYGIHWHALNKIEYIATDEDGESIPWVRATLPNGRKVEYNDVTNPLSTEEIADAEIHAMDCVDCHNRVGHPFIPPEKLADDVLADGLLSQDLPFVKKEMVALLSGNYSSQEEALAAAKAWAEEYKAKYPEAAANHVAEIEQAAELAEELLAELVFRTAGITWESFPDHGEHSESPGCFRCHDGKHLSPEGESIRLHCNICHTVPVTVDPGGRPPAVPAAALQEPPSHLEANFMADHRFQADGDCEDCHGDITFGSDDSTFCADSSCHGRAWPSVELDAAFPHPIELEGRHAEVWCHDCHEGVRKPEFECANCHEPPDPHFGVVCEDCHTPAGFEGADWGDFEHPMPLENAHAKLDCADCHVEGQELTSDCSGCHEPPSDPHYGPDCVECHTPTDFKDARLPAEMHPIELVGAHETASCEGCHVEGQEPPEYVCSNCHEPPSDPHYGPDCVECHTPTDFKDARLPAEMHPIELVGAHETAPCEGCHVEGQEPPEYVCSNCHESPEEHLPGECDVCHTPEGFAASASFLVDLAPEIEHELDGREDCLMCHDPEGNIKPAPSNHGDYENEQCTLCHRTEE